MTNNSLNILREAIEEVLSEVRATSVPVEPTPSHMRGLGLGMSLGSRREGDPMWHIAGTATEEGARQPQLTSDQLSALQGLAGPGADIAGEEWDRQRQADHIAGIDRSKQEDFKRHRARQAAQIAAHEAAQLETLETADIEELIQLQNIADYEEMAKAEAQDLAAAADYKTQQQRKEAAHKQFAQLGKDFGRIGGGMRDIAAGAGESVSKAGDWINNLIKQSRKEVPASKPFVPHPALKLDLGVDTDLGPMPEYEYPWMSRTPHPRVMRPLMLEASTAEDNTEKDEK